MRFSLVVAAVAASSLAALPVHAQNARRTPVMIEGGTGLDPCGLSVVKGLKANGDGFLSVRASPGTSAAELGRLHNGHQVWSCATNGVWIGIVYRPSGGTECNLGSPWPRTMAYTGPCRWGWVHRNWIQQIAG